MSLITKIVSESRTQICVFKRQMPYQIKWVFDKKPIEILEGCREAVLVMAKNVCPWVIVSYDVRILRNILIYKESALKLTATRTTRSGFVDDVTIRGTIGNN